MALASNCSCVQAIGRTGWNQLKFKTRSPGYSIAPQSSSDRPTDLPVRGRLLGWSVLHIINLVRRSTDGVSGCYSCYCLRTYVTISPLPSSTSSSVLSALASVRTDERTVRWRSLGRRRAISKETDWRQLCSHRTGGGGDQAGRPPARSVGLRLAPKFSLVLPWLRQLSDGRTDADGWMEAAKLLLATFTRWLLHRWREGGRETGSIPTARSPPV